MNQPADASDAASLVQADWHEEYGDLAVAQDIRQSVTDPPVNDWHWTCRYITLDGTDNGVGGNGLGIVGCGPVEKHVGTSLCLHNTNNVGGITSTTMPGSSAGEHVGPV